MFGAEHQRPRRAYADFVRAGLAEPPASPFSGAVGGLLLGSQAFVDRIRDLLRGRSEAEDVPELKRLRSRPSLDRILGEVARYFDCKQQCWSAGRRSAMRRAQWRRTWRDAVSVTARRRLPSGLDTEVRVVLATPRAASRTAPRP